MKHSFSKRIKSTLPLVLLFISFSIPLTVQAAVSGPSFPGGIASLAVDKNGNVEPVKQGTAKEKFKADELLVKFKPGVSDKSKDTLHKKHGAGKIREFRSLRLHHIKLKKGMTVEAAIALYMADPDVEYAEPDYLVSTDTVPNDANFSSQWALHNTTSPGADIDAPDAWNMTTGSSTIVIAVIDTGVDYNHQDLTANIWVNNAELTGVADLDDDANGYTDDIHGIDTFNHDSNPMDDHYHGTHVAGIIGAVGNNSQGIAGLNWNIRIMPCKFIGSGGYGYTDGAIECLQYVKAKKDAGANIVATNNSWGGDSYSQALWDAISAQRDILFIAAAGNDASDNNKYASYPANYDLPNVISVASFNKYDAMSSFSNYGTRTVAVGAPGEDIYSAFPGNNYASLSGTSMAAPHVAGLAALLKAQNPSRDWRDIKNLILSGGVSAPAMNGKTITGKRINAYGSLTCSNSPVFAVLDVPSNPLIGAANTLSALSINCNAPAGPVSVTLGSGGTIQLHDDGVAPDLAAGDGIFTGTWTPTGSGAETLVFNGPSSSRTVVSPPVTISDQVVVSLPSTTVAIAVTVGSVGVGFSQTFSSTGGIQPISWSVISGSLPAGLSLNAATGEISGTPSTAGVCKFTIQVADSIAMTDTKSWTIFVSKGLRTGWPEVLRKRVGTGFLPSSYSPIFADLNGDGKQAIIVADADTLYVFDANGLVAKTVIPGTVTTPVVADIDNDGKKEILVGVSSSSIANPIYAFHGDLTPLTGFPAGAYGSYNGGSGGVSSLVAADLNNDGKMEIIAVCHPNNSNDPNYGKNIIVVADSRGNMVTGWPKIAGEGEFGDYPPAVADIDGDGLNEIVYVSIDGFIHIYRSNGTEVRNWQFSSTRVQYWPPVLADINGDSFPEIIVKYQTTNLSGYTIERINVFDNTGAMLPGWPREFLGSPPNGLAAADLDGDDRAEIIFVSGNWWDQIQALKGDGSSLPGWPVTTSGLGLYAGSIFDCNPIVGDINGDGQMEVLVNAIYFDSGTGSRNGAISAYTASGSFASGYPKYTTPGNEIRSTPAIGDLDNNGRADIAVKSEDGMLYVWEEDQVSTGATSAWPMFRHDPQHMGNFTGMFGSKPFPFTFIDQTNVAVSSLVTSNTITIKGINVPVSVTILGGEYEINNSGIWSSTSGTLENGNTVRVRQMSSANFGTRTDTILTVGGLPDTFSVTTQPPDTVPDPFNFMDQTNVPLSTLIISNIITVTGINSATPISITGGEYEINGSGIWSSAGGTVVNNNTVRVRQTSSLNYGIKTDTDLTVGGVSERFSITTLFTSDIITTASSTNYVFGTWTSLLSVNVILTATGDSAVAAGYPRYCADSTNTCTPGATYSEPFNVTCSIGSTCTQYVRYFSQDVLGNTEIVKSSTVFQTSLPGTISTIAGNGTGTYSGDGGAATLATVNSPYGVFVDTTGNLFIADTGNNRIRKVDASDGKISTVAGNGTATYAGDGGAATSASLYHPYSVFVDVAGNIFIADTANQRIRKVNASDGKISTVAGNGTYGFGGDGGAATSAGLQNPAGVFVDTSGNILIADQSSHRIRKVNASDGKITTVAGNGTATFAGDGGAATSASLNYPRSVFVDASGNIFITDMNNNRIRKVNASDGKIATVAGNGTATFAGDGGAATSASLYSPCSIFVDTSGNIFITDQYNHRIRKVNASDGKISTVAGNGTGTYAGDGGAATSASFNYPHGVSMDTLGNIFIADQTNSRIRKVIDTTPPITNAVATGYTFGNWTSSGSVNVTLSTSDGSGIASGYPKYCIDTTDTCIPNASYSSAFTVTCAAGSTCTQYVRYQAQDNVGNIESVQSRTINQDLQLPVAVISSPSTTATATAPVNFTVTYSDANFSSSSLAAADVTLNTTGMATGTVSVTGSGSMRTVTISNIAGIGTIGTIGISLAAGTAVDFAGNAALEAGPSEVFSVTANTIPDPFFFTDQTGVPLNTAATSNNVAVTGINEAVPVTISGGEYELNNSGLWSSASGTVVNGNTVRVRQTSSSSYGTRTDTILTVGGVSGTFSVTTIAADTTPDPFTFIDQANVAVNTLITSNSITVTDINSPAAISITGGEYEVNGSGLWISGTGTISSGYSVRVRQTSSSSYGTRTDTVITIGGVSETFSVTTSETDLIVSLVSAPLRAKAGKAVTITDTTANIGTGASGSSTTSFYLSMNTTYDGSDVLLGSRTVGDLSGGASSQGMTSFIIPPGTLSGKYYVIAVADAGGTVSEASEGNNMKASSLVNIGPDLIITALSVPGRAGTGGAISVTDTTANSGRGISGKSTTSFYLSTDTIFDGSDVLLGSRTVGSLSGGASSRGTTSMIIPPGTAPGTYYIIAVADANGKVSEASEVDNTKASSLIKIGPDLAITALSVPGTAGTGGAINVTDTTANTGRGPTGRSTTSFYLSTDATYDGSDVLLGSRTVGSLPGGANSRGTTSMIIPPGTAPGTYYIIAVADAGGTVGESSETNNTKFKSITIN